MRKKKIVLKKWGTIPIKEGTNFCPKKLSLLKPQPFSKPPIKVFPTPNSWAQFQPFPKCKPAPELKNSPKNQLGKNLAHPQKS